MIIRSACAENAIDILVEFDQPHPPGDLGAYILHPATEILGLEVLHHSVRLKTEGLDLQASYVLIVLGCGTIPIRKDGMYDHMSSAKELGHHVHEGFHFFRVFAPQAEKVVLELFDAVGDERGDWYEMVMDEDGVWEVALEGCSESQVYGYRVFETDAAETEAGGPDEGIAVADPWGKHTISRVHYRQESRTCLAIPEFDWTGDRSVSVQPRDAIIYEMHVKDLTRHPSSGCPPTLAGSYAGFIAEGMRGGLAHVVSLGVNVIELLPCQHFASMEPPYLERTPEGWFNSWNPYARNYWGYMPSYYFSPEPGYASSATTEYGSWHDSSGRHINELKALVKECHREGIAVILDVVYNHTSHYNIQPLRILGAEYYYHRDAEGRDRALSGCGNDLHTARPLARRLIIDSLLHWMREYHLDGFRFDLGAMIDPETMHQVAEVLRAERSDVLLITEPWGGGQYDLSRFSAEGILSWNDIFRNSVKGVDPISGQGWVFGTWGWNRPEAFGSWILGCTTAQGGPLSDAAHGVNYLESHDGYTLGDFFRIALGRVARHGAVSDVVHNAVLSEEEKRLHRLAALTLAVSQGAIMIHEGQEYGRSKVIADRNVPGTTPGALDHDSYNKDDDTNWLNFLHADWNNDLVDYYRGLFALRSRFTALRHAAPDRYRFLTPPVPVSSGFEILPNSPSDPHILVLLNVYRDQGWSHTLPPGSWFLCVDATRAVLPEEATTVEGTVYLPPSTGMLIIRNPL